MICANCGKELEEGSEFCEGCGEKVEIEEIETEAEDTVVEEPTEPEQEEPGVVEEQEPEVIEEKEPEKEKPAKAPPAAPEKSKTKSDDLRIVKPLGIFSYLWMFILMLIPVVDVIMVCVWAFGKNKNPNKKNFAWAIIILVLIGLAGWLLLGIVFVNEFDKIIDSIIDGWESIF